jgi:uncharacterized RDD family membrane protein YckC
MLRNDYRMVLSPSAYKSVDRMTDEHREITVETLSTPPLQVKPASLQKRMRAAIVDSLIIGAAWLFISIAPGPNPVSFVTLLTSLSLAELVCLATGYYFVLEGLFAQTVGKLLMRLIVLEKNGDSCSFSASFRRNILRPVDWLPFLYFVGLVAAATSGGRQRIGDRFANTIVTNSPEKDPNPPPAPFLFH